MNNRRNLVLSIIAILTLLVVLLGATYAYFTASGSYGTKTDVRVGTSKEDILTFEVGSDINIDVTQSTFKSGKGNASDSTFGKATLTTTSDENKLKSSYNLYLDITQNELSYTSSDNIPELLLKVTDASGTELTSISGLEYKEVIDGLGKSIKGFDITTKTGLITILNNQEIVAKSTKTDIWNIEIILVNLDFDQTKNAGKKILARLQITKEEYEPTLADYIKSLYVSQGVNGLYLHNGTIKSEGIVIDANDGSYRYAGSNPNNYVCFGTDEKVCPNDNLYRIIGVFGSQVKLIKADFANGDILGINGAYYGSTSYKTSDYPNYKGSLTLINTYYWNNYNNTNTWSESKLNKINLNTNYITYLNTQNTKWANMIAESSWQVGGNTYANLGASPMYLAYQNEIVSPFETTIYNAKIGLMYISDYGYATNPTYWMNPGFSTDGASSDYRASVNDNWMYLGIYEWIITRNSDNSKNAFHVNSDGYIGYNYVYYTDGVRPVFYLTTSVTKIGGSGTSIAPYLVNL